MRVIQLQCLIPGCSGIDLNTLVVYTFVRNRCIKRAGAQISPAGIPAGHPNKGIIPLGARSAPDASVRWLQKTNILGSFLHGSVSFLAGCAAASPSYLIVFFFRFYLLFF